jgi:hypothetical protein
MRVERRRPVSGSKHGETSRTWPQMRLGDLLNGEPECARFRAILGSLTVCGRLRPSASSALQPWAAREVRSTPYLPYAASARRANVRRATVDASQWPYLGQVTRLDDGAECPQQKPGVPLLFRLPSLAFVFRIEALRSLSSKMSRTNTEGLGL